LNFSSLENGSAMGESSLRMALLKAMQEIGGEQAMAGSLQALQTTADPAELALMAAYLQKADPEQYRDSVLAAAHEALEMAASGKWDGRDVAPLFDLLKAYGGERAAGDLERYANVWFNYTPLALAELPEGAGVPSLIRLNAGDAVSLGKDMYQRMLAQVANQSPEAAEALVQLARDDKISPSAWPGVAEALQGTYLRPLQTPVSGDSTGNNGTKTYHIALGNQNYREYQAFADMSPEQATQQIGLIDRVLGATKSPVGISSMQQARAGLSGRL